uniref:Putative secreted peptide n=1 Tax=Anopheles braziliensis TaxID=58242 RepID=A0A2M3ZTA2_9DIPT
MTICCCWRALVQMSMSMVLRCRRQACSNCKRKRIGFSVLSATSGSDSVRTIFRMPVSYLTADAMRAICGYCWHRSFSRAMSSETVADRYYASPSRSHEPISAKCFPNCPFRWSSFIGNHARVLPLPPRCPSGPKSV